MVCINKERRHWSFSHFTETAPLIWKRPSEDSAVSGSLTHFQWSNQKALEASCHFSLECFLSKNRKGRSVSHTLTEAPYQCASNAAKRHNAQSSSCRVIVAARSGPSLCCRLRTRTNDAAFESDTSTAASTCARGCPPPPLAPRRPFISQRLFSFAIEPAVS